MSVHHRRFPVLIAAGLVVVAAVTAPGGAQEGAKPKEAAKAYDEALRGMAGRPLAKVIATIEGWKFQCLDAWEAVSPDAKEILKHNRRRVKFSKKDIGAIFGPAGTYRIVVYNKLVGTDATRMGTIGPSGMTTTKDLDIAIERYTVIRAVFRDDALVDHRVWPIMDQSALAGGTFIRR